MDILLGQPLALLIMILLLFSTGCERQQSDPAPIPGELADSRREGEYPIKLFDNFSEAGDLDAIRKRGVLRLLVDPGRSGMLKRAATQQDLEIAKAQQMAHNLDLELVVLEVQKFSDLIPLLNEGKGDLIANNLLITDARKQLVEFSDPTFETPVVLVSRDDISTVKDGDRLRGRTLTVTAGTEFANQARQFTASHADLELKTSEDNYIDILVDVGNGKVDFTIVDELALELVKQFRSDLKINRTLTDPRPMAWAIRQNSPQLRQAVDENVRQMRLAGPARRFTGDLDAIRERGILRAVTRNHPGTYFMWKGQIMGFEFSLLEKYAEQLGVRLEIVVADRHDDFVRMLRDGDADIAASLIAVNERRQREGMAFSEPYIETGTGIMARSDDVIEKLQDLDGRTIYVRKSGSHYDTALRIRQQVPGVKIELVPEELDINQIIDRVADGDYDLTIADEISAKLERAWRHDIAFALALQQPQNRYAWMLRDSNPKLRQSVDHFFTRSAAGKLLPELYARYFETPKRSREEIDKLNSRGEISPFDKLVRHYAEQFEFDWRLITAQMFQESTFDPEAKSWAGAKGLMQVMPETGKQVGEEDLWDPRVSIRAGTKYLDWLYDKFADKGISKDNMMWFTLAAYNAGLGHVYDAQDLAQQKGWNRNIWFDNVEKAMLLLSDPAYHKRARYGYARGQEPFDYVRKIQARFRHYVKLPEAFKRQQQSAVSGPVQRTTGRSAAIDIDTELTYRRR